MPTPPKGPRLGGSPAHERLILANLAQSLFEHGQITTTETKAKRLRPFAEKLITSAKRGTLHDRREVLKTIRDKDVVHKLFAEIGPSFATRDGGYTRIIKTAAAQGRQRSDGDHRADRRGDRVGSAAPGSPAGRALRPARPPGRQRPPLPCSEAASRRRPSRLSTRRRPRLRRGRRRVGRRADRGRRGGRRGRRLRALRPTRAAADDTRCREDSTRPQDGEATQRRAGCRRGPARGCPSSRPRRGRTMQEVVPGTEREAGGSDR